jgi:hypothetical protein
MQNLKRLCGQVAEHICNAGYISARTSKTLYEARPDWISCGRHNDGNRRGCSLCCCDSRRGLCNYGIWMKVHDFFRELWQTVVSALGCSGMDNEILAFDITQISHPLPKTVEGVW